MRYAFGQPIRVKSHLHASCSAGYCPGSLQFGFFGLHSGIGPSSALSIGAAIATYVQANPTIRINMLTARFMVFSLRCEVPGRKPHGGGIIQKTDPQSSLFSGSAGAFCSRSAFEAPTSTAGRAAGTQLRRIPTDALVKTLLSDRVYS